MEVRTLGRLADGACTSCEEGPPSSQSILALYRGEQGALLRVVGSTLMRSALIAPGVALAGYLSGARGLRLAGVTIGGSLVSAVAITGFLAAYYAFKGRPTQSTATSLPAGGGAPIVQPGAPQAVNPGNLIPEAAQEAVQTAIDAAQQSEMAVSPVNGAPRARFAGASFGRTGWGN